MKRLSLFFIIAMAFCRTAYAGIDGRQNVSWDSMPCVARLDKCTGVIAGAPAHLYSAAHCLTGILGKACNPDTPIDVEFFDGSKATATVIECTKDDIVIASLSDGAGPAACNIADESRPLAGEFDFYGFDVLAVLTDDQIKEIRKSLAAADNLNEIARKIGAIDPNILSNDSQLKKRQCSMVFGNYAACSGLTFPGASGGPFMKQFDAFAVASNITSREGLKNVIARDSDDAIDVYVEASDIRHRNGFGTTTVQGFQKRLQELNAESRKLIQEKLQVIKSYDPEKWDYDFICSNLGKEYDLDVLLEKLGQLHNLAIASNINNQFISTGGDFRGFVSIDSMVEKSAENWATQYDAMRAQIAEFCTNKWAQEKKKKAATEYPKCRAYVISRMEENMSVVRESCTVLELERFISDESFRTLELKERIFNGEFNCGMAMAAEDDCRLNCKVDNCGIGTPTDIINKCDLYKKAQEIFKNDEMW
ncbi:MAG: hypothetical protein LBK26_00125 [Rickettsiales bacterium]|jgi:hypothetical protein|nr:hypothetical protein [Rickettsiales bacterium]